MPFAPKCKLRGGGGGAVGRTDGQTMAGAGCGGGGGGGGGGGAAVSASRGKPEKAELVLGVAQVACTLPISHRPDVKIVSRVR